MSDMFFRREEPVARRVLLIEDDKAEAHLMQYVLRQGPYGVFECTVACRLEDGLKRLREDAFDVAIVDLGLPDSEGLSSLDAIREACPDVPAIVLTGTDDEALALEAVRRGAQDYLVKGFASKHALVRAIRYAIERKRLEEQVLQAQRMQAVGSLADGIAHEFNNLLQVITGYTRYALEALEPGEQAHADLQQVVTAAQRAARLTEQLLEFGRPHERHLVRLALPQLVDQLAAMLRPLLDERIEFVVQLDEQAQEVVGDENLLQQALMNLCINARDAMSEGGVLQITSRLVDIEEGTQEQGERTISGKFVVLSVSDTGRGIPQEIREQIFNPFFTTKSQQDGTGLGLSVVYGVMQKLGGTVEVSSEIGQGSRFDLYLPLYGDNCFQGASPDSNDDLPTSCLGMSV